MTKSGELLHCLNCNRSEGVIPLVSLRYAGNQAWICSQCLPTLIHKPVQLAGKLENAERFTTVEAEEDR